jgi:hypothetical protein
MRIESSVTSVSWIPSAAVGGTARIPFEAGVTHYDNPPPDHWADVDSVVGPEGARFGNELRAWIEVDDGRITGYGQAGGGRISTTAFRLGGMRIQVEAVAYPELRPEPLAGDDFVRFTQTAGGRPGMPAPRLVRDAPFVRIQGPTVWTTLALTLYADGSTGHELVGASSFPRHWIYGADGQLAGKSALIDFKTWYRTSTLARSPWRRHENAVLAAEAETPLERQLSGVIMRGGLGPKPRPPRSGPVRRSWPRGRRPTTSCWSSTAWSRSRSPGRCWPNSAPGRSWANARRSGKAGAPPRSAR